VIKTVLSEAELGEVAVAQLFLVRRRRSSCRDCGEAPAVDASFTHRITSLLIGRGEAPPSLLT
jgi:hypothetical protein